MNASLERPSRRWWVLAVIATAELMSILDATVLIIAAPSVQRALKISDVDRQWIFTAYAVAFGGLLLLGGRVADYVGRKRTFLIGLIGFAVASAFGGAAQDGAMLFCARAIQGAGAAVLVPAALSLLTVTFAEGKERDRAFSVYTALSGGAGVIGLILGGVLSQYASWRWCLLINVPVAAGAFGPGYFLLDESTLPGRTGYDIAGAVLGSAGVLGLVFGFSEAAQAGVGWAAAPTLVGLTLAVVLLVAFVVVELRSKGPLLPLRIVLDRVRGGIFLAYLLLGVAVFAPVLFLTYYWQNNLGYRPIQAGLAFVPYGVCAVVAAGISPKLLPRLGPRSMMIGGLGLTALGLASLTRIEAHTSWATHVLPGELLIGGGVALAQVALVSMVLAGLDPNETGAASATLLTAQQVGGSLAGALLTTFYATAVSSYLSSYHLAPLGRTGFNSAAALPGYHAAFRVAAGFAGASLIAVLALVRAPKATAADHQAASIG